MYYPLIMSLIFSLLFPYEDNELKIKQTYSNQCCKSFAGRDKWSIGRSDKWANFIPKHIFKNSSIKEVIKKQQKSMQLIDIQIFLSDNDNRIEGGFFKFEGDSVFDNIIVFCIKDKKRPIGSLGQYNEETLCFTNIDSIKANYIKLLEIKDYIPYQFKSNKLDRPIEVDKQKPNE